MNRRKTAVLQNAYSITETKELNKIYSLSFSMPADDEKAQFIQPFHYARYGEDGELYRIIKSEMKVDDKSVLSVTCEHVIAVLCDNLMFGDVVFPPTGWRGGFRTRDAIEFLLSKQSVRNWVLDECDFNRKFEYLWSQENILNALYSIPKEFSKGYKWVFDTSVYPWKVSLKEIDETKHPEYYIRAKRNMLSSGTSQEFADICTRLYPLGYGEGVNQLNISEVNNGVPYLESPREIIDLYGIKEKVLVDRRFENAESLIEYGRTMLEALQTPGFSKTFGVVDLYPITGTDIDNAEPGEICRMTEDNTVTYITKTKRVFDDPGNLDIELSTKATDVADTIADLADRIRIESVYAQGSTQLYQHSKDANATKDKGSVISLYFPSEMRQINKVMLKIELKAFRSYSQATNSSSEVVKASEAGGGSVATSNDGGGSASTNAAAGSNKINISGNSDPIWRQTGDNLYITNSADNVGGVTMASDDMNWRSGTTMGGTATNDHTHTFVYGVPSHTHGFKIPNFSLYLSKSQLAHSHSINLSGVGNHSHSVSFNAHSHKVPLPAHTHDVKIPSHSHTITSGIFESSERASKFDIYIGGTKKASVNSTSYDGDITEWLLNDSRQVPRDSWINVEIRPDKLAYVVSSVFVQGFVQSRGGGNY